jgi:ABC-type microcin C transport system duplicated ATPase subunit YejF
MVGDSQTLNLFKSFNTASGMSIVATAQEENIMKKLSSRCFNTASGMSIVATGPQGERVALADSEFQYRKRYEHSCNPRS